MSIRKYPRTHHIAGSMPQRGDEELESVPLEALHGKTLVIEEKVDGANCGISFDQGGRLLLQSRGHFLVGGPREKQFDLLKQWAHTHADSLRSVLGARYLLYAEWLYAKHTIFYDRLPSYLMEFDVLDQETELFLSTPRRADLLKGLELTSVRVLHWGQITSLRQLAEMVGPSAFISDSHLSRLAELCARRGLDPERILRETDPSRMMEGLYIKVEQDGGVTERYKFVREGFIASVVNSETHWQDRPLLPNQLA